MTYEIILQPRALADIDHICAYLVEKYSAAAAAAWYAGCIKAIDSLSRQPERCQVAHESAKSTPKFVSCSTADTEACIGFYSQSAMKP